MLRHLLTLLLALVVATATRAGDTPAKVYVILWFDTEDYILPASDDAALRLADFLSREGVRATFKVVGEKARTLERRGRQDVIAALKKHEIGYHANTHSIPPSPAQYCADLDWDEGVGEFDRRERPGFDDVRRIFDQSPSCYGQPGSSWTPQSYGALRRWGVPVYLDAGSHVNLDERPCYYGGLLTLYKLAHTLRADLNKPGELPAAEERFLATRKRLQAEGGGIVSIYYHPCEWVHKQFWDGVNFKYGASPPREAWQLPPAKSAEETRTSFEIFERYIRFLKRFDDVRFITATEAAKLYADRARGRSFNRAELRAIADQVKEDVTYQKRDDDTLAASDVLALLNDAAARQLRGERFDAVELKATPFGPARPAPASDLTTVEAHLFRAAVLDVADAMARYGRVPSSVWFGSAAVSPETYLRTLAGVLPTLLDGKPLPATIEVRPARLAAARHVADDGPNLWGWVIFPKGMRAPTMMQLAKRQAWSLKPALLRP